MNKSDLVELLARRMDIPQYKVKEFIKNLQDVFSEELSRGERSIVMQGFGTFTLWEQSARQGRNPRTGQECLIQARKSVKFKPGKYLLGTLNEKSN